MVRTRVKRGVAGLATAWLVTASPRIADAGNCPAATSSEPAALMAAAECMAGTGEWAAAARLYERVASEHPTHALGERALRALVDGHTATARWEEAARAAEQFAGRYPDRVETPELLVEAAWLRVGLGQRAAAEADFEKHEQLLGRKDPGRAAAVFWSRRVLLGSDDERIEHAEEYLRRYGTLVDLDRRIVVEASLGQIEWRRACSAGAIADACIAIRRGPAAAGPRQPRGCAEGQASVTVHPRDEPLARAAQRRFAEVLRAADGVEIPEAQPERRVDLAEALAAARLYRADRRLEEFLKDIEVPRGLALAVDEARADGAGQRKRREASLRRISGFVETTRAQALALEQEYAELARVGDPAWAVAAAGRVALIHERLALALMQVEVPAGLPEAGRAGYCEVLAQQAEPLLAIATAGYRRCRELSRAAGRFDEHSRLCEAGLHARDPRAWPLQREFVGEAGEAFVPEWVAVQGLDGPAE